MKKLLLAFVIMFAATLTHAQSELTFPNDIENMDSNSISIVNMEICVNQENIEEKFLEIQVKNNPENCVFEIRDINGEIRGGGDFRGSKLMYQLEPLPTGMYNITLMGLGHPAKGTFYIKMPHEYIEQDLEIGNTPNKRRKNRK